MKTSSVIKILALSLKKVSDTLKKSNNLSDSNIVYTWKSLNSNIL